MDGRVVNSTVVIRNEAKYIPTLQDISNQAARKALLELILANPSAYTTKSPDCINAMAGITTAVPVVSGFNFRTDVEEACKAAGVRCMVTNCCDYNQGM